MEDAGIQLSVAMGAFGEGDWERNPKSGGPSSPCLIRRGDEEVRSYISACVLGRETLGGEPKGAELVASLIKSGNIGDTTSDRTWPRASCPGKHWAESTQRGRSLLELLIERGDTPVIRP